MIHKKNIHEGFPARTETDPRDLNLYNFESEEAIHSSYILTSPRSLKACRLANVKPIELLHRSVDEIAADLNLDTCQVNHIYFDYEQERLKKLEICKLIRKHILTTELIQRSESVSPVRFTNVDQTSRLTQPSEDCTLDLLSTSERCRMNSYSVPTTPLTQYNSLKKQKNKLLSFGLSSSNSALSLSSDSENFNYQQRSKSAENKKCKLTEDNKASKKYNFPTKKMKNYKKNVNKLPVKATTPINDRELCWEIDKTKKAENDVINKQIQAKDKSKKKLKEKKKSTEKQEIVQNKFIKNCENLVKTSSKTEKRQTTDSQSKILPKKRNQDYQNKNNSKQVQKKSVAKNRSTDSEEIFSNTKVDFNMSNENVTGMKSHDARILDAMVLKKEKQESQDNFANRANIIYRMAGEVQMPNKNYFHLSGSRNYKSEICACNENFAMETYFQQIKDRIKQLKENCIQQLDRIKQQIMKKEIEEKDSRIERLKIKREQEISNCRAQAHYTAELREQLRDTLTPETFDKKVNDVLIKSKFINRLLTTNSFGESKIRLG